MSESGCTDCGEQNSNQSTPELSMAEDITEENLELESNDDPNARRISFGDVQSANRAIISGVNRSMCIKSKVGPLVGMDELWMNLAYEQLSSSIEERAARYVLYKLTEKEKMKGVVTASAGCFAKGLCHQGFIQNCSITVFMPNGTETSAIDFCQKLGGTVVIEGDGLEVAMEKAKRYGSEKGIVYVDAYDHPDVIAALGTVAIETLEDVYEPDVIIVPVGGGGILAGVSVAVKKLSPKTKIYTAESEKSPAWSSAIKAGKPVNNVGESTFPSIGINSFKTAKQLVDQCMIVEDKWIAAAMVLLMEHDKIVLAPASCVGLAAILSKKCKHFCGKRIVCILSTANVDAQNFIAAADRGLIMLGRLVRVTVTVKDLPNALPELVNHLKYLDVRIRSVSQDRAFLLEELDTVLIKCVCETDGVDHVRRLRAKLTKIYGGKLQIEARDTESICSSGRCQET